MNPIYCTNKLLEVARRLGTLHREHSVNTAGIEVYSIVGYDSAASLCSAGDEIELA